MAYQKRPSKGELHEQIRALTAENIKLQAELEAEEQRRWEVNREKATVCFWETIKQIFPGGVVCQVRLEHIDRAGYWFTFELVNDKRRQTFAIRHDDF